MLFLCKKEINVLKSLTHIIIHTCVLQEDVPAREVELKELKDSLQDTQPVGAIVNCCRTLDQVREESSIMFKQSMNQGLKS